MVEQRYLKIRFQTYQIFSNIKKMNSLTDYDNHHRKTKMINNHERNVH